ncbi:MAG TPA: xanthine dehydrogenase family protein subunit M [Vicinamibacterales bacterium]|nr:xanthine dehydrogenase family protein subunit M [Vicinamibacterales bacterium]
MIPTSFDYARATSLDDAIAKLGASGGSAKLVAGGHSLIPLMKLRLSEPTTLIDIARIPGLAGIKEKDGKIEIGAATTHYAVASSALLRDKCAALAETAETIGDPQVRNRGTLGGSLAHADPAADYPAVLLALDAEIHIKGKGGWRAVKASDFFQGLFTVNLQPDEIIAGVHVKPQKAAAYAKLHQRASHFAIVGVAAALEVSGGNISAARVGLTGASTHAMRLSNVEAALAGKPLSDATIAAAAAVAGDGLEDLNSDIHASADYRRQMIKVFTRRALEGARARV